MLRTAEQSWTCERDVFFILWTLPTAWKFARICVVHKSDDKSNVEIYRPIPVLSNFSKVLETVLTGRFSALGCTIISEYQHGFMSGRSTLVDFSYFSQHVTKILGRSSQADVIYTDTNCLFQNWTHWGFLVICWVCPNHTIWNSNSLLPSIIVSKGRELLVMGCLRVRSWGLYVFVFYKRSYQRCALLYIILRWCPDIAFCCGLSLCTMTLVFCVNGIAWTVVLWMHLDKELFSTPKDHFPWNLTTNSMPNLLNVLRFGQYIFV